MQRGSSLGFLLLTTLGGTSCAMLHRNEPLISASAGGTSRHELRSGGRTRSFYLHLPAGYSPARRYPLIVLAHGHNGNGSLVLHQSRLDDAADRAGVIVAAPNGTGRWRREMLTWNVGGCCGSAAATNMDDVGFVESLVDTLAATLPIDRDHVTIAGFSAGGMLALRVACDRSSLVTAVVNVQGTMPDTTCRPRRPLGVLLIAGDRDEDMQAEHAENSRRKGHAFAVSAAGTLRFWAAHNGCSTRVVTREAQHYVESVAQNCPAGGDARLVTVRDHPHAWPGGRRTWWLAPSPSPDFDATTYILEFLDALRPRH